MTKFYWFNIQLGNDFEFGRGVYAPWVCLVLDDEGRILWENCHPTETDANGNPKTIWTKQPDGFDFLRKKEIVDYVNKNPDIIQEKVLESYDFKEAVHLYGVFSIYCYECFDSEGENFFPS